MTTRLYYPDSYLKTFSAAVVDRRRAGGKPAVVLDRTAFYPDSGGQPHDTGTLADAAVVAVEEDDAGDILHILDRPIAAGPVTGTIDWARRFDHMQQHTGQHVLSQALLQSAGAPTLSFHLGEEVSTIDVGLPDPLSPLVLEAEDLADRIVFEDRPVHILTVEKEDLGSLGVRKDSEREGEIRVIDIEGFDRSPCGGTHVRRTGEIGMIVILGGERYKGGTRIEFLCGGRVLKALRREHDLLKELGRLYSAHPDDLPDLARKGLEERAALARENSRLKDRILGFEAQELLDRADKAGGIVVVRHTFEDRTLEEIKVLARKIAAGPATAAVLALRRETAQVVAARSADSPGDCGAAIRRIAGRFGGRGGGKPDLAQAGGIAPDDLETWMDALESYFREPAE